jgi:hypothetical protein
MVREKETEHMPGRNVPSPASRETMKQWRIMMSIREAYKKKGEAEVELARARLAEFRAKGKTMA